MPSAASLSGKAAFCMRGACGRGSIVTHYRQRSLLVKGSRSIRIGYFGTLPFVMPIATIGITCPPPIGRPHGTIFIGRIPSSIRHHSNGLRVFGPPFTPVSIGRSRRTSHPPNAPVLDNPPTTLASIGRSRRTEGRLSSVAPTCHGVNSVFRDAAAQSPDFPCLYYVCMI